jgi:hypothetical protein
LNKLIFFLLLCFWSSKKYCKFSLGSPMVMKCFPNRQEIKNIW